MQIEIKRRVLFFRTVAYAIIGSLFIVSCAFINPINHYLSALLLIICGLISYFYIVLATTDRNWLDLRAVFSLVWLVTIGLANLRLLEYQEQWQGKTWVLLALAYGAFQIGILFGEAYGYKQLTRVLYSKRLMSWKNAFSIHGNRIFPICVGVTLIGFIFFVANVVIRDYIPFFVPDQNAYAQFYTKFYLFAVAATSISGLCYYSLKTGQMKAWKIAILYLCILYSTFLFPILAVSRGTFLTSALILTTVIFYLNNKRFWILVLCVLVTGGVYAFSSAARGYSDAQLDIFFEPATISTNSEQAVEEQAMAEQVQSDQVQSFTLPSKVAFLYSYLTVSHDNFNEAVQNSTELSYGIRQFIPFNVILRLPLPETEQTYLVREHLNTYNLIGDAYYDFHEVGVVISVFIWAFIFGAIQAWYLTYKGPFSLLALGNTVSAVALSFFAPWMSVFSHWMHWGTALLLFLICSATLKRNQNRRVAEK